MFPSMRRIRQQIPDDEAIEILEKGEDGVLALSSPDGYPYAVPVNYVYDGSAYDNGRLIFHGALTGHRMDCIAHNPKASFCVVGRNTVLPADFSTEYVSVICFGTIRVIDDDAAKREAVETLGAHFSPDSVGQALDEEIASTWRRLCMYEMVIEHMTGKESKSAMKRRIAAARGE